MSKSLSVYAWPIAIVLSLLSVVVAGVITYIIAVNSRTDLVYEDSYERGLAYQDELNELNAAKTAPWNGALRIGKVNAEGNRPVVFEMNPTPSVRSLEAWKVIFEALRPSDKKFDIEHELLLVDNEQARFSANLSLPLDGLWLITVRVESPDFRGRYKFRRML